MGGRRDEVAHLTRVALIRTGIVLDSREGALPKMLPPFKMFVGGPLGSGTQYMPWIHRDDWVRLVAWAISHEGARGPLNATAPNPVTNRGVFQSARPRAEAAEPPAGARLRAAAACSVKWLMRCCSADSAPCPCAQQISAFRSDIADIDEALANAVVVESLLPPIRRRFPIMKRSAL